VFFRELLNAGYGLLPGRLPGSSGYLGREVSMAVSGRSCRNERRKILHGANDSVCSGTSNFISDRRSAAKRGPVGNIMQVLCSGCDRKLKSGTQCESCSRW